MRSSAYESRSKHCPPPRQSAKEMFSSVFCSICSFKRLPSLSLSLPTIFPCLFGRVASMFVSLSSSVKQNTCFPTDEPSQLTFHCLFASFYHSIHFVCFVILWGKVCCCCHRLLESIVKMLFICCSDIGLVNSIAIPVIVQDHFSLAILANSMIPHGKVTS